jgi:hypothetical protein
MMNKWMNKWMDEWVLWGPSPLLFLSSLFPFKICVLKIYNTHVQIECITIWNGPLYGPFHLGIWCAWNGPFHVGIWCAWNGPFHLGIWCARNGPFHIGIWCAERVCALLNFNEGKEQLHRCLGPFFFNSRASKAHRDHQNRKSTVEVKAHFFLVISFRWWIRHLLESISPKNHDWSIKKIHKILIF